MQKKVIYTIRDFWEATKELADRKGIDYIEVRVMMKSDGRLSFDCYAHGYSFYIANTPEESLLQLEQALFPLSKPNIDVVIAPEVSITESEPVHDVKETEDDLPFL